MLLVSWGELLWDLFPDGRRLGGAAANVAVHAAELGVRAALISRVGADELGRAALAELRERGLEVDAIQVDDARPTGTVRVELERGEPRFTVEQRAAWDRIELTAAALRWLRQADCLCFGTLAGRTPLGLGALRHALRTSESSLTKVCDLNIRPPHTTRAAVDAVLEYSNVVKLNDAEAAALQHMYGADDAVGLLLARPQIQLVARTKGDNGAELWTRSGKVDHPGYAIDATKGDRVGAGDAFTAVLAAMFVSGRKPGEIVAAANRYASWVASQPGATPRRQNDTAVLIF